MNLSHLSTGLQSVLPVEGRLILAIIGAGTAGRSLAAQALRAGHRVVLEDVLPSNLRSALAEIEVARGAGTLHLVQTVEDAVRQADLVIDFVPDELESKLEIISMIDRMAPPKTMLCIPTRQLSISDLASCTYRAELCIAARIDTRAVDLITGTETGAHTVATMRQFWTGLGHAVTVSRESMPTGLKP